jgi:hypothetical protein
VFYFLIKQSIDDKQWPFSSNESRWPSPMFSAIVFARADND